jgi:serine/threonine protein kinase
MSNDAWYCEHCGAASSLEQTICFACGQARTAKTEREPLLHKRYRLQAQIGTGGFGCVYHALDTHEHNRSVAIKQINLRGLTPQQIIEATDAFNREVHLLSTLSHPHLPQIYEHFTDSEHWYLVMSFIDGETLEQAIERRQKQSQPATKHNSQLLLPLNEILNLALQICNVLDYLHSRTPPIIFRDLKPSNIMHTPDKRYFLIDFGIARLFKPGQQKDTIPFGSPGYAAPEQYGKAQTTPRSDIYSLGALLYYLISGNDPAEAPFHFVALPAYSSTELRKLEALVTRMIALDVSQRPANIPEVQTEIQHVIQHDTIQPLWTPPVGQTPPLSWPSETTYGTYGTAQQQILHTPATSKPPTRRTFLRTSMITGSLIAVGVIGWEILDDETNRAITGPPSDSNFSVMPAISSDGSIVVQYNDMQGKINVIDTIADKTYLAAAIQSQRIQIVAISSDNKTLLVVSENGHLEAYNIPQKTPSLRLRNLTSPIELLSWSPDSHYFAANTNQSPTITLWSMPADKQARKITLATGWITSLAWSPDTHSLGIGNSNGIIEIFDVNTGIRRITYSDQAHFRAISPNNTIGGNQTMHSITALDWSSKGIMASGDSNNMLFIWDANTGQTQAHITCSSNLVQIKWSPDERYLAAMSEDGKVFIWDMRTKKIISTQFFDSPYTAIAWQQAQPGGDYLMIVNPYDIPEKIQIPAPTAERS